MSRQVARGHNERLEPDELRKVHVRFLGEDDGGNAVSLPGDCAGLAVLAQVDAEKAHLAVIGDGKLLKVFPLQGLLPPEMPLMDYVERLKTEARFIEQYRRIHWEQIGEFV